MLTREKIFVIFQVCNVVNCYVDDHSRVVLQDASDSASDYINANYIDVSMLSVLNCVTCCTF